MGHRRARSARRGSAPADMFEAALLGDSPTERKPFDAGSDRKTLQLCRQVERAVALGLAGSADDLLRDLVVDGVSPIGSPGHLMVRVIVPAGMPVHDIMARLDARTAALRAEVAASICRKRVPALSFIPVAAEVPHE